MPNNYENVIAIFNTLFTDILESKKEYRRAVLGDGNGNVLVSGRPDFVWVREDRVSNKIYQVFNKRILATEEDTPVLIGQLPWQPGLVQVVDIDWQAYARMDWSQTYNGVAAHAALHQWSSETQKGADAVSVYMPAIQPLKCSADGLTLNVNIQPINYFNGNNFTQFAGQIVNLATYVPIVAGKTKYVLIYLDKLSNQIKVASGTEVTNNTLITPQKPDIPEDAISSAFIRLTYGQTKIEKAGVEDCRQLFSTSETYVHPTGDGFLHVPATGTENEGKVLTAGATAGSLSWQAITPGGGITEVIGTSPISVENGTTVPNISIPAATPESDGYMTSTYASKLDGIADGATANDGTVTSVAALTFGTDGTDLSSTVQNETTTPVITLQVPTASATNRGALSAADWSTFNGKQPAGTYSTDIHSNIEALNAVLGTNTGDQTSIVGITGTTTQFNTALTDADFTTQAAALTSTRFPFVDVNGRLTDSSNFVTNGGYAFGLGAVPTSQLTIVRDSLSHSSKDGFIRLQGDATSGNGVVGFTFYEDSTLFGTVQMRLSGVATPNTFRLGTYIPNTTLQFITNGSERFKITDTVISVTGDAYISGKLGIGGITPTRRLDLLATGVTAGTDDQLRLTSARAAITTNNLIGGLEFVSNDTSLAVGSQLPVSYIRSMAGGGHTSTSLPSYMTFGVTPVNTVAPVEMMRINATSVLVGTTAVTYSKNVFEVKKVTVDDSLSVIASTGNTSVTADASTGTTGILINLTHVVPSGYTNSGSMYGIYSQNFRNGTESVDSGTLKTQTGALFITGHNNTGAGSPITTISTALDVVTYLHSGSITTLYGLRVRVWGNTTTVTNRWGIFQEDTLAKNYFGGVVLLGTTTTASARLVIDSGTGNTGLVINRASGASSIKSGATDGYLMLDSNGASLRLNNYVSDDVILVNGGGNVLIGSTTATSGKLQVTGAIYASTTVNAVSGYQVNAVDTISANREFTTVADTNLAVDGTASITVSTSGLLALTSMIGSATLCALVVFFPGTTSTAIFYQSSTSFSTKINTASKVNVYMSNGTTIVVQNKTAGAYRFKASII